MADDNKPTINPTINDDLNIDFDIVLDQSDEISKPKENKNVNTPENQQNDSDLNFDLSPNIQEKKPEPVIQDITVQVPIPTQEIQTPISQQTIPEAVIKEDVVIQETTTIQEIQEPASQQTILEPVIQEDIVTQEAAQVVEEIIIAPQINVETPITEIVPEEVEKQSNIETIQQTDNPYNPDLNAANETIQQLQEAREQWNQTITSNKLEEIPTAQTFDAKITQQETQTTNKIPLWAINLDDILPATEIQTQSPIQDIPQVQFPQSIQQPSNPYDIAPAQQSTLQPNINGNKKHLIMVVWIVAVCLIAWFFILKTMYPIQFGSTSESTWNNTTDTNTQATDLFQQTPPIPTEEMILTWETLINSWIDETINELTWNIQDLSWDILDHNVTTGETDPFQALDNLQTTDEQKKQATIDSLKEFVTKWEYYLNLWKQKKISDMMKYGTSLKIKSTTYINQIENWEILDISWLDAYLAQSSWYLQKLQDLENAPDTTSQGQENTWFTETWTQTDWSTWSNAQL